MSSPPSTPPTQPLTPPAAPSKRPRPDTFYQEIPDGPAFSDSDDEIRNNTPVAPRPTKRARTAPISMGRCWMLTVQPWSASPTDFIDLLRITPRVSFAAFQLELAPSTGQRHLQCYIEFTTRVRLSTIKALGTPFDTAHCEKRRGTQKAAIDYCSKEETRAPGFGFYTCDFR